MKGKRVSFPASEDVLLILAQRRQEAGASVREIIRRALRKAYATAMPGGPCKDVRDDHPRIKIVSTAANGLY